MIFWLALASSSTTFAPRLDRELPFVRFEWLSFLFFHVKDNGILVEYAYSFLIDF